MGVVGSFIGKLSKTYIAYFAEGGTVAEEVISSIRNTSAFHTQEKLARQYDTYLIKAEKAGYKLKSTTSSMIGFIFLFIYLNYGLAFWMGSRFLVEGSVGLSQILTIQMSIMIGAFALGNVAPNIQAVTSAIAAANKIYAVIDRVSPLDPASTEGEKLDTIQGNVELRDIKHVYPSRPDVVVMDCVNLLIPAGKSTAIVGASGSGKSTIVGLIERFYDPVGGSVYIDNHDVKDLNLSWLRKQISLVSQEPVLFSTSIYDNIKHGLIGTTQEHGSGEAIHELVERAAKTANMRWVCTGFITSILTLCRFQFFLCFTAIIFGAESAGTVFAYAPDLAKARNAAASLKSLFDRKPEIDSWSQDGRKAQSIEGHIEFKDVHFRYATRPDQPVLRGLNLQIKPGQYVAFVGASGCGKSTAIALLERFYDPISGSILIDGVEISSFNVNEYRSHLALVSQEPNLYGGTIRENILLGTDRDNVSEEELVRCCKDANIYDFIISLPSGLDTPVGSKGCMLSGGQKQRVSIARALVRQPKILLLDEATSALDSESEKVVQTALDTAAQGCTTIAVAHRLSTVRKADVIYVFNQGRIVEFGTHEELVQEKGTYFELVNLQSLNKA
ncbi:hypothetical protein VMCG_10685 [Cytospora schulzeri]|uniref:ABC transporter domain-containing protein n=1 Tax=Cytospora schulzeri TaxID=448051 RepID=A0A423V9K2_9PEZI|nr:hypothetical protein VMCG_10685 [Valsa malicola]